ncbi:MAG: hypothetical protein NVS2B17_30170 [Candidatus Velthaea sp.]
MLTDGDTTPIGATGSTLVSPSSTNAPVDNIPCTTENTTGQHFHVHLSLFVNGGQYAIPTGIGIYHGVKAADPSYFYDINTSDTTACVYAAHSHAPDGIIHIATSSASQQFTLGQILDVWGVSLTANSFWTFSGPTRVFVTDENIGSAGSHPVTEVTGIDPKTIPLSSHKEYTIEVGTAVNTPNYTFGSGLQP